MKFSKIAAAALIAAVAVPAMAKIGVNQPGSAEMFLIVTDKDASFAFDTGLKFSDFVAGANTGGYTKSWDLSSNANWAAYKAIDTNLNDGTKNAGTRWQFAAVFTDGAYGVDPVALVTTKNAAANLDALNATSGVDGYFTLAGAIQLKIQDTNQLAGQVVANGSSVSAKGTLGYYGDLMNFGSLNYYLGNKIGDTSKVYYEGAADFADALDPVQSAAYQGVAKFDGTTLSYAVAAVPEPESYALMLAGLVAVGFVARRRRAA